MKKVDFSDIAAIVFILLFAYTATSKFLNYGLFVFQMRLAPLPLMTTVAPLLGWLLPVTEAALVLFLTVKKYRLTALYASVSLMTLFEIYIIAMLSTGDHLPCTCGGFISTMTWKQHLPFNAVFIIMGIIAIFKTRQQNKAPHKYAGSL